MSIPIVAWSGTELMLSPPWIVPDVQSGLTHQPVRRVGKAESLQLLHRTRCLVDSIVALLRHRAMSRHALGLGAQPECTLVPDEGVIGGRLSYHHGASTPQHAIFLQVECTLTTSFFAGRDDQRQPRRVCKIRRHSHRCNHKGRHTALHVAAAAPEQLSRIRFAGKRILLPGSGAERYHIDVACEAQRRLAGLRSDVGQQVDTRRAEAVITNSKTCGFEDSTELSSTRLFVTGRVDRVQPQDVPSELYRVELCSHGVRCLPELTEICLAHLIAIAQFFCAALGHHAALGQNVTPMCNRQRLLHILLHQQNGHTRFIDAPDDIEVLLHEQRRQTRARARR